MTINQRNTDDNKTPLGECCFPGSQLPLFKIPRRFDLASSNGDNSNASSPESSLSPDFLDMIVLAQWEDRAARGLFRYDVTACETKVLPGEFGFIAQLNEGRHTKKRPTEFRVDHVLQQFDSSKFNFTKAAKEELLFCIEECDLPKSEFFLTMPINKSTSAVLINVSPIEYGHVLLVPHILDRLPQRIDLDSFLLALNMAVEANNPFFRIGYNSLGAFATINHLHFQAYYLSVPFAVERAHTAPIISRKCNKGVRISELLEYPVRGLVFETGNCLHQLAVSVVKLCRMLQDENIPYNMLIADCGSQVYLFPQCYAERQACGNVDQELLETQVNPAAWEISGHMVFKRREDYEKATEGFVWKLLSEVSLDSERFQRVKNMCLRVNGEGCTSSNGTIQPTVEVFTDDGVNGERPSSVAKSSTLNN